MSLQRQLLIILLCLISSATLIKASFLSLQRVLIQPSQHPALAHTNPAFEPNQPVAVTIPHKSETLQVFPSLIQNGEWPTSDQGVSLLQNSTANDTGHIMYGHNWSSVLGNLHQAQIGEEIGITLQNGDHETYIISSIFSVPANRMDILDFAQPHKLLMYTCTGLLDTKRLVVLATKKTEVATHITK